MSEEEIRVGDLVEVIPDMSPRTIWAGPFGDDVYSYAWPGDVMIVVSEQPIDSNYPTVSVQVVNPKTEEIGWIGIESIQRVK